MSSLQESRREGTRGCREMTKWYRETAKRDREMTKLEGRGR